MVTSTGDLASARAASIPPKPAPAMTTLGRGSANDGLLLFRDAGTRRRAHANDEQERILVLGAVPMHLSAEMGDEAAGRHRHREVGGIEFGTAADPPGALEDRDETVIGMEVRPAEVVALEPLVHHHVEP